MRIYLVTDRATENVVRFVRASTLNSAVRAVANELFAARSATTEELYQAYKTPGLEVLDAIEDDTVPALSADDPGPVPPDAKAATNGHARAAK
jgi:hypothetical protein